MVDQERPLISIVTETFSPDINGVAMTLGMLVDQLKQQFKIQIIKPGRRTSSEAPSDITTVHVPSAPIPGYPELRFGFPAGGRILKLWQDTPPDAIYIATQGPLGWSALKIAKRLNIPVTSGFHTNFHLYSRYYGLGWLSALIALYLRRFHSRTRRTLAPTRQTIREIELLGIKNATLLSRGVDAQRFSPDHRSATLRAQWGAGESAPVMLYVGRVAAEKNVELAISAFRRSQKEVPESRLVVVGSGPLLDKLKERNPDIIFTGSLTGTPLYEHYASADIFLFPSQSDTFGNVILEAMASSLAIVSFDTAAAREHLIHSRSGMLSPEGDTDSFSRHTLSLALQPSYARRLGHAAREKARFLDWTSIANQFSNLLMQTETEEQSHARYSDSQRLPTRG